MGRLAIIFIVAACSTTSGVYAQTEHEDSVNEYQFAQHIEAAYEFELGHFHLGPMLEVGLEKHGTHFMAGVHFGFDF